MDDHEVIIAKGKDTTSAFLNGVKLLGGFKGFIEKDDIVFIKITLNDIQGFPSHSNMEILRLVIKECNEAGAKKIHVGSIPRDGENAGMSSVKHVRTMFTERLRFPTEGQSASG